MHELQKTCRQGVAHGSSIVSKQMEQHDAASSSAVARSTARWMPRVETLAIGSRVTVGALGRGRGGQSWWTER